MICCRDDWSAKRELAVPIAILTRFRLGLRERLAHDRELRGEYSPLAESSR